jgi:phosphoribosylformylglycinamidine cyclo-ligase
MSKPVFKELAKHVKSEAEMHRTFNMGVGMAVVLPEDRADTVINIANKHEVNASVIGKITEKKGVWIKSKGKDVNIAFEG